MMKTMATYKTTEELLDKTDQLCEFIKECIKSKRFDAGDVDAALDNIMTLAINMDRDVDIQFDPYGKSGFVGFSYVEGVDYPNGVKRVISARNTSNEYKR